MSTKIDGLVVTFKSEVSEEYADRIREAIQMFNHVVSVDFVEADHMEKFTYEMQAKKEVREILLDFVRNKL